jgi:hypothetical protein
MGVLYDMPAFFRWLDEASDEELTRRRDRVARFLDTALTATAQEEARYLLRKIEEEMLGRMIR